VEIGKEIKCLDKGYVKLVDYMGNDFKAVQAARVSYNSGLKGPEKDEQLLSFLIEEGHLKPFEHNVVTFEIYMPIFVERQLRTYRTVAYSEWSRRYTSQNTEYWIPEQFRRQDTVNIQGSVGTHEENDTIKLVFENVYELLEKQYQMLIREGVAKEQARAILPVGLYTKVWATANLRNWLHLIKERTSEHTQAETRIYANAIQDILSELFPLTFKHWKFVE